MSCADFQTGVLNRIDEIIVFHALNKEQLKSIVEIMVRDLQEQLAAGCASALTEGQSLTGPTKVQSGVWRSSASQSHSASRRRSSVRRDAEGTFKEGDTIEVDAMVTIVFRKVG